MASGKSKLALDLIKNNSKSLYLTLDNDFLLIKKLKELKVDYTLMKNCLLMDIKYRVLERGGLMNNDLDFVVKEMIEKTVENKGGEFKSFIDKYIESTEDVKIEGLINDSDIFDFYLKYRQYIDPILNNINFFNKNPKDLNKLGLYDFSVAGTKVAIDEIVRSLK